jgi:D-alanyl-D-alanine carboxypeptidase
MSDSEPDAVPTKKKATDKQMANLRKGMEALKAKRETLAKDREVYEEKKSKGEIPADAPRPREVRKPKPAKVVVAPPAPPPEVVVVERKKREVKPNPMVAEMAALRAEMSALKAPAVVKEVVVEKPVDRVVEKTKVLTGSEMLNAIFFK